MSNTSNTTESPIDPQVSERLKQDIERHRVMLGHPPTGPTSHPKSESEIQKRIEESRERQRLRNECLNAGTMPRPQSISSTT